MSEAIFLQKNNTTKYIILGSLFAFAIRITLLSYGSLDYQEFLNHWYQNAAFNSLREALIYDPSNYTPFYTYLLFLGSRLFPNMPALIVIKMISIPFDFICAYFAYQIILHQDNRLEDKRFSLAIFSYLAVLFSPTMLVNSALWGQVDSIYTAGLLACLFFLISEKKTTAIVFFGLALSFKLQAIFIIVLFILLIVRKYIRVLDFVLVPLIYFLMILPAWIAGRPIIDLLSIFINQANFYRSLTMNAPNIYQWLPNTLYDIFYPAGILITISIVFVLSLTFVYMRSKINSQLIVTGALLSVLLIPYLMPKMHDRFFFSADIISIIYAFYFPKRYYYPIVIGMTSFFCYTPALFGNIIIQLPYLAIVMGIMLIGVLRHFLIQLNLELSS